MSEPNPTRNPSQETQPEQPYVYVPPANLAAMSYDELFVEDYVSNYAIGPLLNSRGLCSKTVCPECCVDDFTHVEGCSKLRLLDDI